MPNTLLTTLDAAPSGRSRAVWFDSLAYCRDKLLSGEPLPWRSPGDLTAFFAKAQGMFSSDALLVDLGDLYAQLVADDDELLAAMAARPRPGYALRVLLGDGPARDVAQEAIAAVAATAGVVPVVLSLPSPARWLAVAAEQAGQDETASGSTRSLAWWRLGCRRMAGDGRGRAADRPLGSRRGPGLLGRSGPDQRR